MLFFISFLVIGLFFLLNILLASVFNKFTTRLKERTEANKMKRRNGVTKVYQKFQGGGEGDRDEEVS